jgi:outer membrane receptor protein involved in Fe transport
MQMDSVPLPHDTSATSGPIRRRAALPGVLALGLMLAFAAVGPAQAQEPPPPPPGIPTEEITVTAQSTGAVSTVKSDVGAASYSLGSQAIAAMPGGADASLSQVLLQAPGVNQDSAENAELHIRNEHANVQYRINGILLPEGVSFFGQGFSTRLASSVELITGTLPAQYGLRTAGVVDIETKSGSFAPGGSAGIYGGSYDTVQPSLEYGGSSGGYNYYVAGDYLQNSRGIEPPTPNYDAIHDDTEQTHAFLYLDKPVDSSARIDLLGGTFDGQFQIPNNPGQAATYSVGGTPAAAFDSNNLDERQTETGSYGILSYLQSRQDLNFQVSTYSKYSTLHFTPDLAGDLAFNGIAQEALRQSFVNGVQADAGYKAITDHTFRAGILMEAERASSNTNSYVEMTGGSAPFYIVDNTAKTGLTYSAYAQDAWKLTPDFTLNYGGRFDQESDTEENQLSPRVNTVWQPAPTTTIHVGYANYFTPPPLELSPNPALFAATTGAAASSGDSPIKAERAQYFDAGIEQELLPGLKAGIDVYYKYSRNLLDEGQFGAPVILTPFNYHVGYNKGVELTTTYDAGNFSYYGNLAIAEQKAEVISSEQFNFSDVPANGCPESDLQYAATHLVNTDHSQLMTASAGMSYLWYATRYSIDVIAGSGLRTQNYGDCYNEGTVPSYEQVNLGVSHRFPDAPGGAIDVSFDIVNALDETYLLRSGSGVGVFASQYGPRRSFFMGLRKEF